MGLYFVRLDGIYFVYTKQALLLFRRSSGLVPQKRFGRVTDNKALAKPKAQDREGWASLFFNENISQKEKALQTLNSV